MCEEAALPMAGDIEITLDQTSWTITAKHDRLTLGPDL
jgi:histidine phosphotransferase ChpT